MGLLLSEEWRECALAGRSLPRSFGFMVKDRISSRECGVLAESSRGLTLFSSARGLSLNVVLLLYVESHLSAICSTLLNNREQNGMLEFI